MSTNDFTHKTIVVTGAASGIGQRTAQMLIEAGAQVIALDRNPPDCAVRRFVRARDPARGRPSRGRWQRSVPAWR